MELLKTNKMDNIRHGIGLDNMKQTCKGLGNDITCTCDEELFKSWLYIPTEDEISEKKSVHE